ncbi:MAG: AI-2E family transporter [Candidatus Moraniibacteriota bacterium]
MQSRVSQWLFGQLVLMLIAFVIYYIGLSILGVPYALALALFGGLMEILPYIGPILAAIPAILAALFVSPLLAVLTLAFYTIAHQFEAHVLRVRTQPLGFILAVLIGFELAGPIGIILAVPIAMIGLALRR